MTTRLLVGAISGEATRLATRVLDHLLSSPVARCGALSPWPAHAITDQNEQQPLLAFTRMLSHAAQQSGRQQLGLEMAAFESEPTPSIFGELFTCAPTLGDALHALARYFPVSQTGTTVELTQSHGIAHLSYQIRDPAVGDPLHDAAYTLGKIQRTLRRCAGPSWRLDHVTLAVPAPGGTDAYQRFFGAPVVCNAAYTGLHFSAQALERPIPTADARRYRNFCAQLELRMPRCATPGLLGDALRTWMTYAAREGRATLEQAASDFGVTPRTLQRRLQEQGVGFQDLLAQVRMQTACRMLSESRLPVTRIAEQLGFSETSAFTRAFRNHARMSPRAFRQAASAT
ncbi:MAG TPA: AraC family transcriptional regulator ligand-binding domain-containing protein [Ottowia sp.]|nr:AraC family transcriptional regulator ligand-binding domain-containing protein [Ottowia sp.]